MNPLTSPLLTDLYQLTMLEGYISQGMSETAAFEFYVRTLPDTRGFLLASGLDTLLMFLEQLHFSGEEIAYLAKTGKFSKSLLDYLAQFRFKGDVYAMDEGTVFFQNEPVVRVIASLPEAQLIESRLINILHLETVIASKAARSVLAADGKALLVDFGLRRAHGAEAGLLAARASYIAGFDGTATVLAEPLFGIPVFGTMAHSYIQAHDNELEAFLNFAAANPANTTLLIDTYDVEKGAAHAAEAARILSKKGIRVNAIRLDSGDLLTQSKEVRKFFDAQGFHGINIFASGNLDEYGILHLLAENAPINGFGIGTKLDTSEDAPYLECAYKMVEYAGSPRAKKSPGKNMIPGRKQIFRKMENGIMTKDLLALEDEKAEGVPLLAKVMDRGRRKKAHASLNDIRGHARLQLESLPPHFKALETAPAYLVEVSPSLSILFPRQPAD
ncbi:MAG: nicotinate phosphoribosyltransferase [Syntrophales bacterium]|jgi:nicotinate phosphoribosyltransferase|nr:nicotinate phosphoribosyltransferase [Syntrophales bacterium]